MADWTKITSRGNVDDRRAYAPVVGSVGGFGVVGAVIFIVASLLGVSDPATLNTLLDVVSQTQTAQQTNTSSPYDSVDSYEAFTSTVIGSTNETWKSVFTQNNLKYTEPRLVLFRNATQSGCGIATSDIGPHYCPSDATIYLDETFFDELQQRFNAKGGDVAQAYVIAHEVGHHVQNELGIMEQVDKASTQEVARQQSIKLELQADCFAGIWANSISKQNVLEPGEISEALNAAAAVGDDHIQQTIEGRISPETWTHGSSDQRINWFTRGYNSGQPSQCNTF